MCVNDKQTTQCKMDVGKRGAIAMAMSTRRMNRKTMASKHVIFLCSSAQVVDGESNDGCRRSNTVV